MGGSDSMLWWWTKKCSSSIKSMIRTQQRQPWHWTSVACFMYDRLLRATWSERTLVIFQKFFSCSMPMNEKTGRRPKWVDFHHVQYEHWIIWKVCTTRIDSAFSLPLVGPVCDRIPVTPDGPHYFLYSHCLWHLSEKPLVYYSSPWMSPLPIEGP